MLLIPLSDAHDHYKNCTMILNNSNNCCYNYDNRNNIRITKDNNENNKNYRNTTNNKNYKYHHTLLKIILINFILLLEIVHVGSNSHVLSKCRQTCETYSKESPREKSTLCNTACKASQCEDGCNLYTKALNSSCHELCFKDPNLQKEAWATLSMEEKSCSTGCSKALNLYIEMKTDALQKATLPAPEVERDSVTNSSVYLQWRTHELVPNISYTVQTQMPEISSDWQLCNSTKLIKELPVQFNVHNLHPYTTYKFKIVAFIKNPDNFLESNASVSVTTFSYGKPSSPARIVSVTTPSPTVITVIWSPPLFPNGQLLGYKLIVVKSDNRNVLREVSPNTLSWTFNQLQPLHTYTIKVSAWNSHGEGPADTLEITTPEPTPENDKETPYLVLAASNMVLKQNLMDVYGDPITLHQSHNRSILVLGPDVLCESKSGLIQGIGVHIKEKIVLFSDADGKVHLVYTDSSNNIKNNIYPNVVHPKSISIDWLDNKAYIAGDKKIYQCLLPNDDNCTVFLDGLNSRPKDIQVDPINGYLFYVGTGKSSGIFRVDLGEESKKKPLLIVENHQQSFTIDFQNIQLYFPNDEDNTIMSSFLDGKDSNNIRPNVVKPNFHAIKSMVFFNGSFYWTDGDKVLHEVYDKHGKKYHHNKIHFEENHFGGFNLLHPSSQPTPAPASSPDNLEVLFSDTKAYITWESPKKLIYQSYGFWKGWKYEVMVKKAEQREEIFQVSGFNFTKDKLIPDTQYTIRVRAHINNRYGPWTENFVGHTFHKEDTPSIITYSTSKGKIYQIQTDGQNEKFIRKFYPNLDYRQARVSMVPYKHVLNFEHHNYSAHSIAMDWLAKKIYWSTDKSRGEIRWASMNNYKKSELLFIAPAYYLCIDALKGILYWNTKDSIQVSYLNGMHITQYQPFSFTRTIIAMTIDLDSHVIYWVQNDMGSHELYKADMIGYGNPYVNTSIKFITRQKRPQRMTRLQYYSNHLFWTDDQSQLVISDMSGRNISRISKANSRILSFSLFHPSMHKYPDGLDEHTVKVVPDKISPESVKVEGNWSVFKLSWRKATEINYGEVYYQMNLIVEEFKEHNKTLDLQSPEYTISNLPPYTAMTVSLQALTYYGASEWTTLKIHSPMSVPNEPINPRVYINERKDLSSSNEFLSADLRWSAPSNRFGVLEKYKVYYRTSQFPPDQWNMSEVDPHTRQFILEHLKINETYTFQTEACTIYNCSKKSEKVSITSNNTKPLPELLVANNEGINLAELDNGLKFSQEVVQVPTKAFTFLAKTNFFFWVKNDTNLVMRDGKAKEISLMNLKESIKDLTVDWIDHTIYLSTEKEIQKYNIYKKRPQTLWSGSGSIGSIAVSPYSSTLYWSEEKNDGRHKIFRSNTDGSDMRQLLPAIDHNPQKRSISQQKCQCPQDLAIAGTIGIDYSNENVYFMELKNKSIWLVDDKGCQCKRVFTPNSPEKVEIPNSLTADRSRIYWSNQRDSKIYSVNKMDGKDFLTYNVNNVKKIVAYGSHLQPLPESKCLSSYPESTNISLLRTTNTSVTLLLPRITRYPECEKVSQPVTNYTVHYSGWTDDSEDISCTKKTVNCRTQDTYTRETVISPLKPYTKYVFQVAVSNFYTDYRADVLGTPLVTRTLAGVPSGVRNLNAYCLSYEEILLIWKPPLEPNGNLSALVYMVTYSMTLNTGEILEKTIQLVHHKIYKRKLMHLEYELKDLKANHEYKIKVKSCEPGKKWCSSSLDAHNRTMSYPSPIELINATTDSVTISWRTPSDIAIKRFIFFYRISGGNWKPSVSLHKLVPTMNQTIVYSILYLKSDKAYEFAVNIAYDIYHFPVKFWPSKNSSFKFAFKTLANFPVPPNTPVTEKLDSGYIGVIWTKSNQENTQPTGYDLQIRNVESGNWTTVYNDSHPRWIISDKYLTGEKFLFRVRAKNSRGWGNYSNVSKPFSNQKSSENWAEASVYPFIIIPFIILIVIIILFFTWVVFKKKQSEKKRASHVNDGHNPDVELATLQDLPHIAVQQNNTLYSVSIVPTNADLVALPHFRHDQLIRKKFLGSGAFGEVFEGVCKNMEETGETRVAVKTLRKCASEHEKEEFLKEALLMSNFKHQHILQLLGVCLDGNPQFIVSELMEGGDLLLFLRHYRPSTRPNNMLQTNQTTLTLLDLMKICVHVSRGCKYLEEMHFVHRDLAARNCLVSSKNPHDMIVKIGDFGLARDIYKNDYYRKEGEGLLPVRWMSPESLVDGVFTTQSDIWSFGVLMWEVITYGQQPYPARSNIEVLHYVRTGGILDRPDNCPEYLYQLKLKCWSYVPEDRPTSCFILEQLETFYQRLLEESTQNKNATNGSLDSESDAQDKMVPHPENYLMADIDRGQNRSRNEHKSSIDQEFTSGDDPTPLLADEPESTNASGYLEPSKIETPKYLELISDSHTSSPMSEKQSVRGARPKTSSTSSLRKSPTEKSPTNTKKNNNGFSDLNGKVKGSGGAARRNFQGLHYAQLATCSTDSSVDEDSDDEINKDVNYITPQVSMSCTLLNQLQNETKQRKLSKQTSAPIPVRNNSLSNDIVWLNNSSIDDQNANNFLFHNSCASPTKLQVWADKNRNLVGKNSSMLPISDCPEYINTSQPASLNYSTGRTTGGGAPIFSSQPTLV